LSHEAQIYIAENIGIFKNKLSQFFNSFDGKEAKSVTTEDITKFFEELD